MSHRSLRSWCVAVLVASCASVATAADEPARGGASLGLEEAIDVAARELERSIPADRAFRVCVLEMVGPGDGETGLGRLVTERVEHRLAKRGVRIVDRRNVNDLLEGDRRRPNGSLGLGPERLAWLVLQVDAIVRGRLRSGPEGVEISLRLVDARNGEVTRMVDQRALADERTATLARERPAGDAPVVVALPNQVKLERAVFVQRKQADGKSAAPAVLGPGERIRTGDRVHFRLRLLEDGFLTVILVESTGRIKTLASKERIRAGEWRQFPPSKDGTTYWFPLEPPAGRETFYVFAEREAVRTSELAPKLERAEASGLDESWAALRRTLIDEVRREAFGYVDRSKVRAALDIMGSGGDVGALTRGLGEPVPGEGVDVLLGADDAARLPTQLLSDPERVVQEIAIDHGR
jgi:hypothetical protein